MLTGNLVQIAEYGKRADGIVTSMLEHRVEAAASVASSISTAWSTKR